MKQINLSSGIKSLTDAVPLERPRETPWQIIGGVEPHIKEYVGELLAKERKIKNTKSKKEARDLFENTFLLLGFFEGLVIEGYIEALDWLLVQIPELKSLKKILKTAERLSRPDEDAPVAVHYGGSCKIYYKGNYYFKYWISNKIYRIKAEEIYALFPAFYKKEVKNRQLLLLLDKAFLKIAKTKGVKDGIFNELKKDELKIQASMLFSQKNGISPVQFHKRANAWIEEVVKNAKGAQNIALMDIFNSEFKKLKKAGKSSDELDVYRENFYFNIEHNFLIFLELDKYVDWIKKNDQKNALKAYVLRDAIGLYENDLIKDTLHLNKRGVRKVVLLNRDMMSVFGKPAHWWEYTTGFLYKAVGEAPKDFDAFLNAYYQHIAEAAKKNNDFKKFILKVGKYLEKEGIFENKSVIFVDTGIQGSVVLFLCAVGKYMQDSGKVKKDITFDVRLYAVVSFLRKVYADKYFSKNFYFIGYLEFVKRQGSLYKYIPGSFDRHGYPKVAMGSLSDQLMANMELLSMIYLECCLSEK